MSSSFTIETFEGYLKTVRDELPPVRKYFRGQSKRASSGYRLLPSLGRYAHLRTKTPFALEQLEREVLDCFRKSPRYLRATSSTNRLGGTGNRPASWATHSRHGLDDQPLGGSLFRHPQDKDR
jgi:hypothetical protein